MSLVEKVAICTEDDSSSVSVAVETIKQAFCAVGQNNRMKSVFRKGRAYISGSGAKPYKQKGTGRSRCGSTRSSIRVGGAAAHGARRVKPSLKVNRKVRRHLTQWFFSVTPCYRLVGGYVEKKDCRDKVLKAIESIKEDCSGVVVCVPCFTSHEYLALRNVSDLALISAKSFGVADVRHFGSGVLFVGNAETQILERIVS